MSLEIMHYYDWSNKIFIPSYFASSCAPLSSMLSRQKCRREDANKVAVEPRRKSIFVGRKRRMIAPLLFHHGLFSVVPVAALLTLVLRDDEEGA